MSVAYGSAASKRLLALAMVLAGAAAGGSPAAIAGIAALYVSAYFATGGRSTTFAVSSR